MAEPAAAPEQAPMVMGRGIPRNCAFSENTTLAPNGQKVYDGQSTGALWRRKGRKETIELAGTFHYAHALEQVDDNGIEMDADDDNYRQISSEDDLAALRYLSARFKGEHALDSLDIFDNGTTAAEMFQVIDLAYLTLDGADDPAAIRARSKGALGMLKKDAPLLTAIMAGTQMVWDGYPVTDESDITMLVYKLQAELGKHKSLLEDVEEEISAIDKEEVASDPRLLARCMNPQWNSNLRFTCLSSMHATRLLAACKAFDGERPPAEGDDMPDNLGWLQCLSSLHAVWTEQNPVPTPKIEAVTELPEKPPKDWCMFWWTGGGDGKGCNRGDSCTRSHGKPELKGSIPYKKKTPKGRGKPDQKGKGKAPLHKKRGACYVCGESGHYSMDCPERKSPKKVDPTVASLIQKQKATYKNEVEAAVEARISALMAERKRRRERNRDAESSDEASSADAPKKKKSKISSIKSFFDDDDDNSDC